MDRDPTVYIALSLNTNMEPFYVNAYLFGYENQIVTRNEWGHPSNHDPHEALHTAMEWGAEALSDFFTDLYGYTAS